MEQAGSLAAVATLPRPRTLPNPVPPGMQLLTVSHPQQPSHARPHWRVRRAGSRAEDPQAERPRLPLHLLAADDVGSRRWWSACSCRFIVPGEAALPWAAHGGRDGSVLGAVGAAGRLHGQAQRASDVMRRVCRSLIDSSRSKRRRMRGSAIAVRSRASIISESRSVEQTAPQNAARRCPAGASK